jgi:acetyl coenzyme A synthetase (ADP forming)-like protein
MPDYRKKALASGMLKKGVVMHPVAPALPGTDEVGQRLVLRDGSVASVRHTTTEDTAALGAFFHGLSFQSRYQRFLTAGDPPDALVARLSDSSEPARALTLVAERATGIIATASYIAIGPKTAEVAFAVADGFQGKGLGTALLERLAVAAARQGFERFEATTLEGNDRMIDVFRESGFEIRSKSDGGGCLCVQLSLSPSAAGVEKEEGRNRLATAASLRPLFAPRAVAVVGASRNQSSVGRRVLDAIIAAGFNGEIHPVNPRAAEVAGLNAYASARDLPRGVDLAVIAVPATSVPAAIDDCAAAGVRSVVVISAGFAEAGADGWARQERLTEQVRGYGMRMVGPNCLGLVNADPSIRLNASFSPIFPPPGHIGLLSQSGAIGIAILELATGRRLGLSTFVSVGNKADVSGNDLLEYWEQDPSTHVLLLYLESFGNPRRFARLARRVGRSKPIVVVKSGRTHAGARAAGSHTAAIAVSDVTVDALFEQSGIIRADTLDEMFDIAACLDLQPLPPGRHVGIVTNAGGPGIMAADACDAAGLALADLSIATRRRLSERLPEMASPGNPMDMIASAGPEQYRQTIETMLAAPEVDSLIVIFTPVEVASSGPILEAIRDGVHAARRAGIAAKPVLACVMAAPGRPVPIDAIGERLPAFAFPENAARALGKATAYATWRAQPQGLLWGFDDCDTGAAREICRAALTRPGDGWLTDDEVQRVLRACGMPMAASGVAHSADEAVALAASIGFPAVAKLSSRDIQHKTDLGLVRLALADATAVRQAFDDIVATARRAAPTAMVDGVLMQPMVTGGVETMMGIVQDSLFGPLVAFGLGGIHVEIFRDVRIRMAPLTDRDVDELLRGIKGFPLLQGYRGHPPADLDALRELLLRVSRLAAEVPEIAELDLNPVMALAPGHGCRVVDARARVRSIARPF